MQVSTIHRIWDGEFQPQVVEKFENFIEEVSNSKFEEVALESQLSLIEYSHVIDSAYLFYYSIEVGDTLFHSITLKSKKKETICEKD